jgi:hypothetical protein
MEQVIIGQTKNANWEIVEQSSLPNHIQILPAQAARD